MKRLIKRLFTLMLIAVLCFGAYVITAGYVLYQEATKYRSVTEEISAIRANGHYTTLDKIPDIYENAVVATEDHRFYIHGGIDFISMGRALVENVKEKEFSQGGSTITQQLAKNMFFTNEKKLARKVAELFVVHELERDYTKDDILELYINTVYYGSGYYCIYDAAKGYFYCEPKSLSDYQCTMLAGVPNAPSVYAPTRNNDLVQKRHEHVLSRMVKCKFITESEKQEILSERKIEAVGNYSGKESLE